MSHDIERHTGELTHRAHHAPRDFQVAGQTLRTQSPLVLPTHVCVKCGSTEPGGAIHDRVISYVNPWIWLTFLISGLITVIAYLAMRKPIQLRYYLCPDCEAKRRTARVTTNLVTFVSLIGMILTVTGGPFEVFLGGMGLALLARMFWARSPIHAAGHHEGWFELGGASPRFLSAIERKRLES